jgi:hypothetical protein
LEVIVWCPTPGVARVLASAGVDALVVDDAGVDVGARFPGRQAGA